MRRLSTDSDLGRRSALPENSAGRERLSLSQGGMSMSHRSNLELQPHLLSVVLESAWTTMLQNCLNVSGALLMVRAPCHFAHCALPSSMLSPVGFNVVGRKCLENALGFVYHWQPMILAGVRAHQPCRPSLVMQRAGAQHSPHDSQDGRIDLGARTIWTRLGWLKAQSNLCCIDTERAGYFWTEKRLHGGRSCTLQR